MATVSLPPTVARSPLPEPGCRWRTVVEHEGAHHQEDRVQYHLDLGRYAWMCRRNVGYVQSTHERLRHPRSLVGEVFAELVSRGYDGSPPVFGERWLTLFMRVNQGARTACTRREPGATVT